MKKWIHAAASPRKNEAKIMDQKEFVIGLIDEANGNILGYVSGYRRGGFYHPGDVVQCVKELEMASKVFDDEAKAKRTLAQYKNYSEAFIYDKASEDYPMPSEKLKKKEVPTHLEVVEI